MRCPNCSSEILAGSTCPRCGAQLAPSSSPGSVPLTASQKAQLIGGCVPLVFWLLAFAFCATFFDDIYGAPPPAALLLFVGLIVLVVGYRALQRLRDLISGVALVQDDQLQRIWHPRRGTGRYGRFAQLGTLRLTSKAYGRVQLGVRHRVVYSPASKIAWLLEPVS